MKYCIVWCSDKPPIAVRGVFMITSNDDSFIARCVRKLNYIIGKQKFNAGSFTILKFYFRTHKHYYRASNHQDTRGGGGDFSHTINVIYYINIRENV